MERETSSSESTIKRIKGLSGKGNRTFHMGWEKKLPQEKLKKEGKGYFQQKISSQGGEKGSSSPKKKQLPRGSEVEPHHKERHILRGKRNARRGTLSMGLGGGKGEKEGLPFQGQRKSVSACKQHPKPRESVVL